MSRYEIREQEPSELHRLHGVTENVFVVWDTAKDRRAPFGNFPTRARAEAYRTRLEAREGETHAVRIERTRIDGEPVRRFHLLAEVTFRDREAGPRDEHDRNYYRDHELSGVVTGWMHNALEDRDDSPAVRFTEMNHPNILNELRHGYDEIIKLKEMISKLTSPEQTPGSLNGNDARALLRIVWQWIIDANNGNGADSDDLIHELERAGYQCPAELETS